MPNVLKPTPFVTEPRISKPRKRTSVAAASVRDPNLPANLYEMVMQLDSIPEDFKRFGTPAKERGRRSKHMKELHFCNIGAALGLDPSHVSYVFEGRKKPSLNMLAKICKLFNLNMETAAEIFGFGELPAVREKVKKEQKKRLGKAI